MTPTPKIWEDIDVRVIDQRIGQGVGGHDTVIRVLHRPTGIIIEMPHFDNRGQHQLRQLAIEMLEWAILEKRK